MEITKEGVYYFSKKLLPKMSKSNNQDQSVTNADKSDKVNKEKNNTSELNEDKTLEDISEINKGVYCPPSFYLISAGIFCAYD